MLISNPCKPRTSFHPTVPIRATTGGAAASGPAIRTGVCLPVPRKRGFPLCMQRTGRTSFFRPPIFGPRFVSSRGWAYVILISPPITPIPLPNSTQGPCFSAPPPPRSYRTWQPCYPNRPLFFLVWSKYDQHMITSESQSARGMGESGVMWQWVGYVACAGLVCQWVM